MGEIYNISSALPFLDTLAAGVLARFDNLAEITIYLPNRRSARPLAESLFKLAGEKPLILPKIEVIGDVSDEDLEPKYFPDYEKVPGAISPTARLYQIARLIHEKDGVRTDFAQSVALAKSLIVLMDELHNKNLGLDALKNVVPEDFAGHWQVTLDFLKIMAEDWQGYLQKHNLLEPIKRRNLLIEKLADYYREQPPQAPVIIAGTTGTVPATVELVKAVLGGDNGYLVLDGLDRNLADDDFKIIEETHPQYNLGQLLAHVSSTPGAVKEWQAAEITPRQKLISTALLPTELTPKWREFKCEENPRQDLHLIEAANLEEEATAIALALREVLEHADKTAMVVSNNRALAARVRAKMRIWDVEINDAAGENYAALPTSRFLLELAEMLRAKQAPVELLSFFKHPFIAVELKNKIREIELEHLRGPRLENFDIVEFIPELLPLKELARVFEHKEFSLLAIFDLHIKVAEKIVAREVLWKGDRGGKVYEYLQEFRANIDAQHKIDPQAYPEILARFISTKTYRPPYNLHPRINILPPAEARMQAANLVIIAGMNEGSFPALPLTDSFMNIDIRKKIGLDLPARDIGKAAHDFELLSQAKCVVYTRSIKEQGSPAVKSRFLQRLQAVCEIHDGGRYCEWARAFYEPEKIEAAKRPEPQPPLEARPRELSATRVGKLMRDPYVVYAEKILRLKKLADIDEEVTADKFGNFIHSALEKFSLRYDARLETLLGIGAREFAPFENKLGAKTFWWPKFLRIAGWFIANEAAARVDGKKLYFEDKGIFKAGGITFTAKADRIEADGGLKIIDYKTGNPPGFDAVDAGLDPQLAIEAIIFGAKYQQAVGGLEYWYLKGASEEAVKIKPYKRDIAEMVAATKKGLENLAAAFLDEKTPFIARPWSKFALKYNDYEHLARIKEWDE